MEELQNLAMSSTYPGFVQWTYCTPDKELIDRIEFLEKRLKDVEEKNNPTEDTLKKWIPLTYKQKHIEGTVTQGQHGLWGSVLAPYIAAYLVNHEEKLTCNEFNEKYGLEVTSSSYSNWTKSYFYGVHMGGNLFTKEALIYWWKKLGVPEEEYERVLDDLRRDGLIKNK